MRFIKSKDSSEGQLELTKKLAEALVKGQVLWLVTGGQNMSVEINILNALDDKLTNNLNILLTDERYGPKGHKDSNYTQLLASGLNIKNANFPDILENDPAPDEAEDVYKLLFDEFKSSSKLTIGQFGIGDDGHIAGVLPNTAGAESDKTVLYYESNPHKRLTLTLSALKKNVDYSYAFCFGESKSEPLTRLHNANESIESLPSLVLKYMPNVTVYNDQI